MNNVRVIGGRLSLPSSIRAILWDMDGVLINSIKLDFEICTTLIRRFVESSLTVSDEMIREGFSLSPADFWKFLLLRLGCEAGAAQLEQLVSEFERERTAATYELNPGIGELLRNFHECGLRMAVVSNNKRNDIIKILHNVAIADRFEAIVGNDHADMKKKPAPDTYLEAARLLGLSGGECAIIEDSVIGVEAGNRMGAYTIAVSTGGDSFERLSEAAPQACYSNFGLRKIRLSVGNVLDKSIYTPNEFVSHMIEHIAWRLGASIDLFWNNDEWAALGVELGTEILRLSGHRRSAAVVGMIDDGGAEVRLELNGNARFDLDTVGEVSIDHLLSARCEQLKSGTPLKKLIEGLVEGLSASLFVRVTSFEDPHHTWEGVFRAIGLALNKALAIAPAAEDIPPEEPLCATTGSCQETIKQGAGFLRLDELSCNTCGLHRETAETVVRLKVELSDTPAVDTHILVSRSIDVSSFHEMLNVFAASAGLRIGLEFSATNLSSSHVVLEDTGLVLGAALFKIMEARMSRYGINGAGSSFKCLDDFRDAPVASGVSIEGRKFLKLVPFDVSFLDFKRHCIIGHDAFGTLRCEDIDDFLDALAGGMRASILLHFRRVRSCRTDELWREAIASVGFAIKEAIAVNPSRKGFPPGVKATLV